MFGGNHVLIQFTVIFDILVVSRLSIVWFGSILRAPQRNTVALTCLRVALAGQCFPSPCVLEGAGQVGLGGSDPTSGTVDAHP